MTKIVVTQALFDDAVAHGWSPDLFYVSRPIDIESTDRANKALAPRRPLNRHERRCAAKGGL